VPETAARPPSGHRGLLVGILVAVAVVLVAIAGWFGWQQLSSSDSSNVAGPAETTTVPTTAPSQESPSNTSSVPTTTVPATTTPPPTTSTTTLPDALVTDLNETGVHVAVGSTVDPAALEAAVVNARNHGWGLSVVAVPSPPESGLSAYAETIAMALNAGTVVVVAPDGLGWASQEDQFNAKELGRAWQLIPPGSTEETAVWSFVRSVLGGPDGIGSVDPGSARWLLLRSDGSTAAFVFGDAGDVPLVGDWDCDGVATAGVWRPASGEVHLRNSNDDGSADISYHYDNPTYLPVVGDFDGDGCDTLSFYRPEDASVLIFNTKEHNFGESEPSVGRDVEYSFGESGDLPIAGDFDGDGIDTIGLFRPSTGTFYLKNSHAEGPPDIEFAFGEPGDLPIAGDWGPQDGIDSVAVYRPGAGMFFLRYINATGPADETLDSGLLDAIPVAGAFGYEGSN